MFQYALSAMLLWLFAGGQMALAQEDKRSEETKRALVGTTTETTWTVWQAETKDGIPLANGFKFQMRFEANGKISREMTVLKFDLKANKSEKVNETKTGEFRLTSPTEMEFKIQGRKTWEQVEIEKLAGDRLIMKFKDGKDSITVSFKAWKAGKV